MNLDELQSVRSKERRTDSLQHLRDSFYEDVREKDDLNRLRKDFEEVDDMWNKVVSRLNRSTQGYYVRQLANDVNRVHNQIHALVNARTEEPHQFQHRRVLRQDRPVIRLELPGVGAIQFPR